MEAISICFYKLLYMSVVASVIGLSIMLIRKFLSKHISPKIMYAMWIVFLLALVVPPFISTKISVYNYIDVSGLEELTEKYEVSTEVVSGEISIEDNLAKSDGETTIKDKSTKNTGKTSQETKPLPNLKDLLPMLWLVGVVVSFAVYIGTSIIFNKEVGKEEFQDERIRSIFETLKEKFKVKRKIELISQNAVKSPAIVGIIKPKILLMESLKGNTDSEIEYIFRHELSHFKRNDNVINPILLLLRTVHWFNPIVWIIMKEIKKDMEFTADESAVKGLVAEERKEYCKLLVNFSNNVEISFMEKAIGIANDKNNLEKRIDMIKLSDKLSKHPVFSAMLVFIIIGLICLILYTNNYYQPELDMPPNLYIQTITGKSVEMVLTKYEWINGDKVSNYDIEFNPDMYEFKDENTIYELNYGATDYDEIVYTEPRYNISYINEIFYTDYKGTEMEMDHHVISKTLHPNINAAKTKEIFIGDGITQLDVYFPNGSTASYVVRKKEYTGKPKEFFDKYSNIDINDVNRIEELVKTMNMGEFLNEVKVENNVLNINYEYKQNHVDSYNMSVVLFAVIPKLEKIVISSNHKDVFYSVNNVPHDALGSLEITKEEANKYARISIENLQKIIKES